MMNPLHDPVDDASRPDHRSDALALLERPDYDVALAIADAASADYWRARNGEHAMTADMTARHTAYAPVARILRERERESATRRWEHRALLREREGLPRIADVPPEPIAEQCSESVDAPNAMTRVPDAYDEVRSVMRPDGTVGKRGRAVISYDPRALAVPSLPFKPRALSGYAAVPGATLREYAERRSMMVAVELRDTLHRDRDGRVSTIGLDRIAERVYNVPRLVGSEHLSWEQMMSSDDPDVVAETGAAVAHLNPADPVVAAERYLGLSLPRDHGARHVKVYKPHVSITPPARVTPGIGNRQGKRVELFALPRGRARGGDPVGTVTTVLSSWSTTATVHRLAAPSADINYRFIGHALVKRPEPRTGNVTRKRATRVKRERETIAAPTREHLTAIVRAIAPGTSVIVRYRDHDIRVSRHAEHRRYSLRVKLSDGRTVARSNRRTAATTAATIANLLK